MLDEITKMLTLSSTPVLHRGGRVDYTASGTRAGAGGGVGAGAGWVPLRVLREDDVLDNIYRMIVWSRDR